MSPAMTGLPGQRNKDCRCTGVDMALGSLSLLGCDTSYSKAGSANKEETSLPGIHSGQENCATEKIHF